MNSNKFNLALKVTDWCNLNCAHCCERSGPNCERKLMPINDIKKYVTEFSQLNVPRFEHLVFTGGEGMAPYYFGQQDYIPQCLDITYKNGLVPFIKTNGIWGGDEGLRTRILTDLAKSAIKHKKLASLDISVDEFHNNLPQVTSIIKTVVKHPPLRDTIRISVLGLATPQSIQRFSDLLNTFRRNGFIVQYFDDITYLLIYLTSYYPIYYGYDAPIVRTGRAQDNNMGVDAISGQPSPETGNCLQIDYKGNATLNYKHSTPVAEHRMSDVLDTLVRKMTNEQLQKGL